MKCSDTVAGETLPLVTLSVRLGSIENPAVNCVGGLVLQAGYAPSLSGAAVPDHMLTGLAKNVLTFCFRELESDALRRRAELQILSRCKLNGLPVKGGILNGDWTEVLTAWSA